MKPALFLDQISTFAVQEWRAADRFVHALADYAVSAPSSVLALCAFTAAGSIVVTLITFYFWPKQEQPAAAPERDRSPANGVWQLASRGLGAPDIARRTGLSHDAVATILRGRTHSRSMPAIQSRKSRPTAA